MGINTFQNAGANPSVDFVDDFTSKTLLSIKQHGTMSGDHGTNVTLMDDFLGKAIGSTWDVQKGSDAATVNFAFNAAASGNVRATTGAGAGATYAVNGVQLDHALNWKAANGNLVFETKVKISAITTIALYCGFTDQVASLIMPMTLSAGVLTTTASNAVGFLFDTAATAATYKICGVATDVDATIQDIGVAPTAATFDTLRIEVNSGGAATFFRNSVQVGSQMTGAVTASVALTPVIACFTRAAGSATVDVDYILCQQTR